MDPGCVKLQNICVHGSVLCFNLIIMICQKRKNGPFDPKIVSEYDPRDQGCV